jgi:predicted cupin superfamily sugar epimerase
MNTPEQIIKRLKLAPHPEGGWYRETWRAPTVDGQRAAGTAIYFLLKADERSHWHRIDSTEIWHFYAGSPMQLTLSQTNAGPAEQVILGPMINIGERPQIILAPGMWQSARSLGGWSLLGCTVSPGFEFSGFELAPDDFDIPLG